MSEEVSMGRGGGGGIWYECESGWSEVVFG